MKKFLVLMVGLMLISISLKAFEPIRISIVSTPSTSADLVVDVLNSDGTTKLAVITSTSKTTDASGVLSVILDNNAWTTSYGSAQYLYSATDLLRITFGGVVLSIERMEVVIAKQSLFGATISQSELDQTLSGLAPNGTAIGQMQYWNGTSWVIVAPGSSGQVLTSINGVPTWGGSFSAGVGVVLNPTTGAIWMDRNLGAAHVATSSTDADAYGDLYQWGRGPDGHQIRTSTTTATLSGTDTPGNALFITTGSSPYDWRSTQNDNLWQGVNGVNNPCPSGYRLPTEAELDAERASWSSNNSAGAYASPLKFPTPGTRSGYNGSVNSSHHYWSSTVNGTFSHLLTFDSVTAGMGSDNRVHGHSVRCIKN